jgi:hypothetical protein
LVRVSLAALVPLLIISNLRAQTQDAQITGFILDPSNHGLPGASVSVVSEPQGSVAPAHVSADGAWVVPMLAPGRYTIRVAAPGFISASRIANLSAGARRREDFRLETQPENRAHSATAQPGASNETQALSQTLTQESFRALPNLDRNVWQFVLLAGNLSDAGLGSRGAGAAINGQRESSTAILLDGSANRNEFAGSIGQPIPLDAVQQVTVITSDFTAEFGRASGGIVSAVSRSGAEGLHGDVWEFNRISRLATGTFLENAQGVREPAFDRNQFGYAAGDEIDRHRLFLFSSTEATLVRSNASQIAWVPSSGLLARTPSSTQAFFQTLGQLRPGAQSTGSVSLNDLTALYGRNPCAGFACATLPADLPILDRIVWKAPSASAGGVSQNTWSTLARADYNVSAKTRIFARYGLYRESDPAGALATSPYSNYDLGQHQLDNSVLLSATRLWSPGLVSQTSIGFGRLNIFQQGLTSRGVVPSMYANPVAPVMIGTAAIELPGYNPLSPTGAGAFGGPQNTLEINHGTTWIRGRHTIQFGGFWQYIQDNRTWAAYQTAVDSLSNSVGVGTAINGLIAGRFVHSQVAIDPASFAGAIKPPDFARSNRFRNTGLYVQDYWALGRTLSINAGLRWEYFGVQHSSNAALDSNWYAPGTGFADANLAQYIHQGALARASGSQTGGLWKPNWTNFGPRVGLAWDVLGKGQTIIRGGYGIAYEPEFGNVTFNIIQNQPNYAVIDVAGPVTASNYGNVAQAASSGLPPTSARIIDPGLKIAYAHIWSASVERRITGRITYAAEYSGSKGVNLYTISYPNQAGFGNAILGVPCTGIIDCTSQLNPNYSEDVGYRGNQGFSIYHSLNNQLRLHLLRGVEATLNYTWSHAIDNISSTFFEAGGQGVAGQFGSQNVTMNNGNFVRGLLDPFQPALDRGDAEFDARHRVALSGTWEIPSFGPAPLRRLLHGWRTGVIFLARSGQPFSVFDSSAQTLDLNTPRASFDAKIPLRRNTFVRTPLPDTYQLITFLPTQILHDPNPLTPGSQFPVSMSRRDAFRAPGFWNLDVALTREMRIAPRLTLELRGEAYNIFNHANLYVIGASADVGASNTVNACFGCTGSPWDRRELQFAARLLF